MKRAGFTMIELIFVIVIIGILSAVALPRFLGVASQAHLAKVKSYIGTFNMTSGPALWSEAIADGNGSISWMGDSNVTDQLPTPKEINGSISVAKCTLTAPTNNVGDINITSNTRATSTNAFATTIIGSTTYYIGCQDGNTSSSPRLWLQDTTGKIYAE